MRRILSFKIKGDKRTFKVTHMVNDTEIISLLPDVTNIEMKNDYQDLIFKSKKHGNREFKSINIKKVEVI